MQKAALLACVVYCGVLSARPELFPVPEIVVGDSTALSAQLGKPEVSNKTGQVGSASLSFWLNPFFTNFAVAPTAAYTGLGLQIDGKLKNDIWLISRFGFYYSFMTERPDRLPKLPGAIGGRAENHSTAGLLTACGVRWRVVNWRTGAFYLDAAGCGAWFWGSEGFHGTLSLGAEMFFGVEMGNDDLRGCLETGAAVLTGLTSDMNRGYVDGGNPFGATGAVVTLLRFSLRWYFH